MPVRPVCHHPSSCRSPPLGAPSLLRVRPSAPPANSRSRRGTPARGQATPTSCARSGSPAPHAAEAWLPGQESAGTTTPRSLSGIGRRSPLPGRIAPRPPGSDRSVSVRPIDAAAASIGRNSTLDTKILDQKDDMMVLSNGTEVTGRIHRICEVMALAECCARARRIASTTLSQRGSRSSPWPERRATGNVPIRSASRRGSRTTGRSASSGRSPSGGPLHWRSSRPRPAAMASQLRSRRPGSVCMARDRRGGRPAGNHGVAKAMFLNALECDDAAKRIKSRAEPSRAEPSRAERPRHVRRGAPCLG